MKYTQFRKSINKPYFSRQNLKLADIFIFNYQLSLWAKKGYLKQIKRGLYVFSDQIDKLSPQEISFLIYQPSYISTESALSYHGFIPEIVQSITAVTSKTTRQFNNYFGTFDYRHLKPTLSFGYLPIKTEFGQYLLAEPEKALLDYFYLNLAKLNNKQDIQELRLNYQLIAKKTNRKKLLIYLKKFQNKKLTQMINHLSKLCSPTNS